MKNFALFFLLVFLSVKSFSQEKPLAINMEDQQIFMVSSGMFYDAGGPKGDAGNSPMSCIVKAKKGKITISFLEMDLKGVGILNVYEGSNVNNRWICSVSTMHKTTEVTGESFLFEYIPYEETTNTAPGWAINIEETGNQQSPKVTQPESDCVNAIPLCNNQTVIISNSQYTDTGAENDDSGDCYSGTGSGGSVWFSFSPQATGPLDFSIAPSGSTDYDFVLWDITNGCASKTQILCNYEAMHGTTGANSSGTGTSLGSSGGLWCSRPNVTLGRTYALCINFYAGSNDGYVLQFQNEAGSVAIADLTPPTITAVTGNGCTNTTLLDIYFSEMINCTTLQIGDLAIPGYVLTMVADNCVAGKTNHIQVSVSPALTATLGTPTVYTITGNTMNDMCGNLMVNSSQTIQLGIMPVANAGPDKTTCKSPGFLGIGWSYSPGSQAITASGGTYYQWSNGAVGNPVSFSPTTTTTYTVTVTNGGCSATDQVTINVELTPAPNIGADQTICQGASVNLTASGGGTYQWQSTTTTGFFGTPTGWANIAGATSSTYTATPSGTTTTYYQANVASPSGACTGSDYKQITIDPISANAGADQLTCASGSAINLTGTNTNGTTFSWNIGAPSGTQIASIPNTTANPTTSTVYYFTATSATGCSNTDAMTVTLANYGNINNVSANSCDISNITMSTPPSMLGATAYTFNWYEQTGATSPCPTTSGGMTLVNTQTISTFVNQSIYSQNFDALGVSSTLASSPGGWSQQTVTGSVNNWGIGNTVLAGMAGNHLQIFNGATINAYLATDDANQIARFGPISNPNGESLVLTFNWKLKGETAGGFGCIGASASAGDYLQAVISTDGTNWSTIGGPYYNQTATQLATINISSSYNYTNFYIGFRWVNDNGTSDCSNAQPAMIDNINIQANVNQYPVSSFNPPAITVNMTYVLEVVPIGGTCNAIPSLMSTCIVADCSILPIELNSFEGKCSSNYAQLFWTTASEQNNDYFTLEGSNIGQDFYNLATIKGAGTSNSVKNYEYVLKENSYKYFRLKQTDFDGKFSLSDIITVNCYENNTLNNISVYPNPATSNLTLNFGDEIDTKIHLIIKDMLGRTAKEILYDANEISFINVSLDYLSKGIYFLQIEDLTNNLIAPLQKFVKE